MTNVRPRARSSRRAEVLRTAARLFKTHGYRGTSMQQLADAIGLGKGSLYHHLVSKEELVFEIMMSGLADAISRIEGVLADDFLSSADKLQAAIRILINDLCDDFDDSIGLAVMTDGHILTPERRAEYVALRDAYEDRFQAIVESGVASGDFHECDPSLATKALLGMCAWTVFWYRREGPLSPDEIADGISRIALVGIAHPGEPLVGMTDERRD